MFAKRENNEVLKVADLDTPSSVADLIRGIRNRLEFEIKQHKLSFLAVTSLEENSGTSTITFNLANSFTAIGKRVLIIDGNSSNSFLSRLLAADFDCGITNIFNQVSLDFPILTLGKSIDFLPMGTRTEVLGDFLISPESQKVFHELKQRYDLILVDTSPLEKSSVSQLFSTLTDGTVVVINQKKFKLRQWEEFKKNREKLSVNIIGMIKNFV